MGKGRMHCEAGDILRTLPAGESKRVMQALLRLAGSMDGELYVVGGAVRDRFLGRRSLDIDITASCSAKSLAEQFRRELGGGTIVDLSGPEDESFRVVWRSQQVDFATFRAGSVTIEEDLQLRDFTINAMALPLDAIVTGDDTAPLIDPVGGLADLRTERLRHCSGAFEADPLRMLRGYRLHATLGFHLAEETRAAIRRYALRIVDSAAERINHELQLVFNTPRTAAALRMMSDDGLLQVILPELFRGAGVLQPEFHHLDVLGHCFLALEKMEELLADPQRFFPGCRQILDGYLEQDHVHAVLKWAALLHDVGKPVTRGTKPGEESRVTFYRHDEEGERILQEIAHRSRWSRGDTLRVGGLIAMHMHPFHLCNASRQGRITRRAALKLCRRAGEDLPGLFMLAMADSLASRGEKKPLWMEKELVELCITVQKIYEDHIKPVLSGPRLLTGEDLIREFSLVPGPLFSKLLDALEVAAVEGEVIDRETALEFVANCLKTCHPGPREPHGDKGAAGFRLVKE